MNGSPNVGEELVLARLSHADLADWWLSRVLKAACGRWQHYSPAHRVMLTNRGAINQRILVSAADNAFMCCAVTDTLLASAPKRRDRRHGFLGPLLA